MYHRQICYHGYIYVVGDEEALAIYCTPCTVTLHRLKDKDLCKQCVVVLEKLSPELLKKYPVPATDTLSLSCFCGLQFNKATHLQNHLLMHTDQMYQCQVCLQTFKDQYKFGFHSWSHYTSQPDCDRLDSHHSVHLSSEFTCKTCNQTFKWRANLLTHIQHHINGQELTDEMVMENDFRKGHKRAAAGAARCAFQPRKQMALLLNECYVDISYNTEEEDTDYDSDWEPRLQAPQGPITTTENLYFQARYSYVCCLCNKQQKTVSEMTLPSVMSFRR